MLGLMLVLTMLAISIGGLVEIAPLFFIKDTIGETSKGRASLYAAGAAWSRYLHPRGLLHLPFADDSSVPR